MVTSPVTSAAPSQPPTPQDPRGQLAHLRSSLPLKSSDTDKPKSLKKISRELMSYFKSYKSLFSDMPEMLCEGKEVVDDFTCWSGNDVVETSSYSVRVVESGLHAQKHNPEVKVRNPDPILTEAKEMLERFNQEMEDSIPGFGTRGAWAEIGSGTTDGSADCDDEDGCQGSGEGNVQTSHEAHTVSSEGSSQEKEAEGKPPHVAPTITSLKLVPKVTGSAPAMAPSALALLFLLLLSTLGPQWTLL
ncbi:hypothetical protein AGOR_G00240620 [Albula goreensis]|uniref:Glypican-5-like n=1 Tax=Albula goreensis TaxID=1534307 RepID=A0A8T3CG46_9TELE|nr:hypothetical protein AGOR_G00240620 [Albula goreensis]